MRWDTAVIGSGPGGLIAAVALARAGQRVIVLEQHYLPGGWTHSFSLDGYRFSPGVHYIGDLGPGGGLRRLYEGLGLSEDLEFCEMNPDGFDHFLIQGERVDQPKGAARWMARLIARFPHERRGIARYFETLSEIARDVQRCDSMLGFPDILLVPFRAPSLLRWGFRTHDALLSSCVRDPLLVAVLSAQSGNHGLAPSRVSLPLHAAMTLHYHGGGFYPRGGARRIAEACVRELRRNHGEIQVRARVKQILVERGRAAGVKLEGGEIVLASNVVCNADPAVTYGKLLAPEHCPRELRKARRAAYSTSVVSLFCATDLDLSALGYDSGNYWYYRSAEVDRIYRRMEHVLPMKGLDFLFLAISTLKDPGHRSDGHHTLEMFTFVPYAPFARWMDSSRGVRDPEYEDLKTELGDRMLTAAERVIPGLRSHLRLLSIGTPLTNDFYCATHQGACYGTAKTPFQVGPFSFRQQGPIPGLFLCGASTLSHGVAGASMSGLLAAQRVLRVPTAAELLAPADRPLRVYPADHPEEWQSREQLAGGRAPVSSGPVSSGPISGARAAEPHAR